METYNELHILLGIGIFIGFVLVVSFIDDMFERYCKMKERIGGYAPESKEKRTEKQNDKIKKGLDIIEKYEPDADFAAQHDQIWCGEYSPALMTKEDKKYMEELGWFEDEDSWSHFC